MWAVRSWEEHPVVLIGFMAFLAVLPSVLRGVSQGHDFTFHLQSWLDAAAQMRRGILLPHWADTPAWQAGEPRFLFYPPLSWFVGALLALTFPIASVPNLYLWLAFAGAGLAMYRLAREFATSPAALVAAGFYLANPYMLFNAYERSAYAELLAATWIPLLLLGALRRRPTIPGIALPLALVWLTNAPSAVMGSYMLSFVLLLRLVAELRAGKGQTASLLGTRGLAGIVLGLALPGFYLVPAAFEQRFVQVDMAIIPNLRYQDSFLFSRTDYEPHNVVTHTASVVAVAVLCCAAATLGTAWLLRLRHSRESAATAGILPILSALAAFVLFLLFPVSSPVWEHLPKLRFLQFPWRLLTVLSAVVGLAVSLIAGRLGRLRWLLALVLAGLSFGQSFLVGREFRQRNDPAESATAMARAFAEHHGALPTDEYTAIHADNDVLRTDNPGFWLASEANDPAPGTTPNPNETDPNYDAPLPAEHTVATQAPHHLHFDLQSPRVLVLNLRAFHAWHLVRNGSETLPELPREDGLIAVALPPGPSSIDVRWQRGADSALGLTATLAAALALGGLQLRSRKLGTLADD